MRRLTEEEYRALEEENRRMRESARRAAAAAPERERKEAEHQQKRAKYGNRRVEVDGMKFDSEHEAAAWAELALQVRAGELKCVLRQVGFDLPGGIRYIADFVAVDRENRITVLDAKSEITRKNRVYINKKKQMARCLGLEIVEV